MKKAYVLVNNIPFSKRVKHNFSGYYNLHKKVLSDQNYKGLGPWITAVEKGVSDAVEWGFPYKVFTEDETRQFINKKSVIKYLEKRKVNEIRLIHLPEMGTKGWEVYKERKRGISLSEALAKKEFCVNESQS